MAGFIEKKRFVLVKPDPCTAIVPKSVPKDYVTIKKFFQQNIVEIKFYRRGEIPLNHPVGHQKNTRRMLCTANWRFIRSPLTARFFKFKKPKQRRGAQWYRSRNLIIVWDLLAADFRIVSLDTWKIAAFVPCNSVNDYAKFAVFYQQKIRGNAMPKIKKKRFSDK